MQYFNRSFFRLAMGFIGIIVVSMIVILATTALGNTDTEQKSHTENT